MCYPKCDAGWKGTGAICQKKACPSGYPDAGLAGCWKPAPYGRGWGSWRRKKNHTKWGLLWYRNCKKGYHAFGLICSPDCPSGSTDIGLTCLKETKGRGWGQGMTCAPGKVKSGLLCYDPCKEGFKGDGAMCWGKCPSNTKRCGALCIHGGNCTGYLLKKAGTALSLIAGTIGTGASAFAATGPFMPLGIAGGAVIGVAAAAATIGGELAEY